MLRQVELGVVSFAQPPWQCRLTRRGWGSLRRLYFKGEILNQAYISKKIRMDRLYPSPPEDQDELVSGLRIGTSWEWK